MQQQQQQQPAAAAPKANPDDVVGRLNEVLSNMSQQPNQQQNQAS
jgi:hypothetical protein